MNRRKWLKAPRLLPGMTIGVAGLSGPPDPARLAAGVAWLRARGYGVRLASNLRRRHGYFAGDDETRLAGFEELLDDREIGGIVMARGGYGITRLLDRFPYKTMQKRPRLLMGYSDMTALSAALAREIQLVSFHGPMVATTLATGISRVDAGWMHDAWEGGLEGRSLKIAPRQVHRGGPAVRGRLLGGCLSLLAAAAGTAYDFDFDGAILFLEDVGEDPYKLDRMLTQLRLAGTFRRIKGMLIGQLRDCGGKPGTLSLRVPQMLDEILAETDFPVVRELPFGHANRQMTLPVGVEVELDPRAGRLRFLEDGVA